MVIEMRKEYMAKEKTLQKDIEYALLTSLWACELIVRLAKETAEPAASSEPAAMAAPDDIKAFYNPCRV